MKDCKNKHTNSQTDGQTDILQLLQIEEKKYFPFSCPKKVKFSVCLTC